MTRFADEQFQIGEMDPLTVHAAGPGGQAHQDTSGQQGRELGANRSVRRSVGRATREARRRLWHVRHNARGNVRQALSAVARPTRRLGRTLAGTVSGAGGQQGISSSGAVTSPGAGVLDVDPTAHPSVALERQAGFAQEMLTVDPSPRHLGQAVQACHRAGDYPTAARLAREHAELVERLSPAEKKTVIAVQGLEASAAVLPPIPDRAVDPLYRPEPGRVLYGVHASPLSTRNGYASRTRGFVDALSASARDVVVAVRPGGAPGTTNHDLGSWTNASGTVRVVSASSPSLEEVGQDQYLRLAVDGWMRLIQRHRPSVVVCASNFLTALPALIAARHCGIRFVYEVRGQWHLNYEGTTGLDAPRAVLDRTYEHHVVSHADHVAVIDNAILEHWAQEGLRPQASTEVPNGVDIGAWAMLPIRERVLKQHQVPAERFVVAYAGAMVPYEGLDLLVRMMAAVEPEVTDAHLVLVGDGVEREQLQQLTEDLGVEDRVTFTGSLPPQESQKVIQAADVVAIPRRATATTRVVPALKPLEAMAAGKPVLLSDLQVHRHLAQDVGEAVIVVPHEDPELWGAELTRLAAAPEACADRGRKARLAVFDRRQWADLIRPLVEHLDLWGAGRGTAGHSAGVQSVSSLRIALISDEFTRSTLQTAAQVLSLTPDTPAEQVADFAPDLLLVESAWEGLGGSWRRKVGFYSDEEFADLRRWVSWFQDQGVQTIFWNKEDPVHTARFRPTAALFDVVLSTDAGSLVQYLRPAGERQPVLASLPFFASPAFHRPSWAAPEDGAERVDGPSTGEAPAEAAAPPAEVMYAGTYYGDRYPTRTKNLDVLLEGSAHHGLVIHDRQAALPDSPYTLPERFAAFNRGALPYEEVVRSYRTTPFHLNVNSAQDSQTMLSRRCMEVAASGGVVLSGPGRAVQSLFDGVVPVLRTAQDVDALLRHMEQYPEVREVNGWNAWRTTLRSHTAERRLAQIARLAGRDLAVDDVPPVGLSVQGSPGTDAWRSVAEQSLLPQWVRVDPSALPEAEIQDLLAARGVQLVTAEPGRTETNGDVLLLEWSGQELDRVSVEDAAVIHRQLGVPSALVLRAAADTVSAPLGLDDQQTPAVLTVSATPRGDDSPEASGTVPVRVGRPRITDLSPGRRPGTGEHEGTVPGAGTEPSSGKTILLATHDPKFTTAITEHLQTLGHRVLVDRWESHSRHDPEASEALLAQADIIWCEWGLGNVTWYSHRKREDQRLVCRVHAQEVTRDYIGKASGRKVDAWVFVAPHVERTAQSLFTTVAPARSHVVPNMVDLMQPRYHGERHNDPFRLGFVGMVPRQKSLHRALDLVEMLHREDPRFHLHVLGRPAESYPWVMARPEEAAYFTEQRRRMETELSSFVHLDGTIEDRQDLADWYRQAGWVASMSDHESFHFTTADGAVHGARPLVLAWPGSSLLYPREALFATVEDMAAEVLLSVDGERATSGGQVPVSSTALESAIRSAFDVERAVTEFTEILLGH